LQKERLSKTTIGFIITFLAAVLFSTKAIIIKKAFAETSSSPLTLLALRMLFSLPFYIVAAFLTSARKSNIRFTPKQWLSVFVIGVTGYYISSLLDFTGLKYVSAGLERLILFLYPTFAVLINAYLFKHLITKRQKIALLLTYIGIGIAYIGELNIDTSNPNFFYGSFLIFLCAVTFSIYLVGSGQLIPKIGASKFTAYAMLAATIGVLSHFFIQGDYKNVTFNNSLLIFGFLLAIFATVIPSFLLSNGMKTIGANNAAIVTSIGPVSTIIQAHLILGERVFAEQIIGTLLVITGVILIGWKTKVAIA
jgi:drug/metabolite transporter (DMT)-like permease